MNKKINIVGEKIKLLRTLNKLSQEELSQLSGITISSIKKYECGIRNPKKEQLDKLSAALGVSTNAFLDIDQSTSGDILSLIAGMDNQCKLKWSFTRDDTGNILPDTISMAFTDHSINTALAAYLAGNHTASIDLSNSASVQSDRLLRYMNSLLLSEHHKK